MGKQIKIKFYLRDMDMIKTKINIDDYCSKDEEGFYHYKMESEQGTQDIKVDEENFCTILYTGIIDTLDKYHEAKLNGGAISNEKVDTIFAFGDIIVPIEAVNAVKVKVIEDVEYSDEDLVTVEEC